MSVTISSPRWILHPGGSFDLETPCLALRGAYPAVDRSPLHPVAVEVTPTAEGGRAVYRLEDGARLVLHLGRDAQGLFAAARLENRPTAPHWVHPLHGAQLTGVDRLLRTGIGFSGPTNVVGLAGRREPFSFESYLVTGLIAASGATLALGCYSHADFLQQTEIHNRVHRINFRNREVAGVDCYVESGFSTERIAIGPGGLELPALRVVYTGTCLSACRELARQIGRENHARVGRPSYHWCSWYHRASHLTIEELIQFLDGAQRLGEPLMAVQIDDGYAAAEGDWLLPNAKWPGGLERAFDEIRRRGYRPGIWIAPYMVERRSRLFSEHPDWMLHDLDGRPIVTWKRYDGSHHSEEFYILDSSHPEAFAYLRHVFATFRQWGCQFYKTDFVEWGFKDSTTVRRHSPGKTSAQYHDDVARMIRQTIGEEAGWLGCIAYFAPYLGLVDAMRVSSDTGHVWRTSPEHNENGPEGGVANVVAETYHTLYFNNLFWQNDPDALILRDYHTELTSPEVEALALFCGLTGVVINTSDRFHEMTPERLNLWRFIRPQSEPWEVDLPGFDERRPLYTAVRTYPALGTWAAVVLNPTSKRQVEIVRLRDWCGLESAACFRWGPGRCEPLGETRTLAIELEPHTALLYYISPHGTPPPPELTVGGYSWPR